MIIYRTINQIRLDIYFMTHIIKKKITHIVIKLSNNLLTNNKIKYDIMKKEKNNKKLIKLSKDLTNS